ncbi:Putative peptidase S9, prolyl oligopeptidase, catalytic domain, alpha/Beta hydrolase [Septoria linicola]|uniref:Peptidase S9, prolyl oligopeptidase, catalytic domain, alpha/Beta hydrolase n=1 Tax=Septoria linicola TaxID=215465 RepID=A0A9Q9EQD6_9PEZI|nr:Putative peptidase S9, prolyl oligopeptidase, catalytic domain, alpha/Beta hydrolase [Septoria linicola]
MWWNELNVGHPVDNTLHDAASNLVHAHEVNGSLLLLVAELDDNVDPASTLQVVNALNAAEKDFDFMLVPGAGHGVQFSPYVQVQNKVKRFWKTWKNGNGLG